MELIEREPKASIERESLPERPGVVRQPLSIGKVSVPTRFFLAPLAGYTSLAFRIAVRELGGLGLATTDLVNARSLIEKRPKSFELAETIPEDQPMAIQLYGHVVEEMRQAARWAQDSGASVVDVNMGCPVRKVVRSGGGSALLCDAGSATALVENIVSAVSIPVTVKMRLGWDDQTPTAPELARAFEQVGVAAVIVHGRTRAQGFRGGVSLEGIRSVVEAVQSMPVVGNGDVLTIADAARMFEVTGCSAISIGRGALANPFFFRDLDHWAMFGTHAPEPSFDERVRVMDRHFQLLLAQRGEQSACLQFRKLIKWYYHFIGYEKPIYHKLINLPSSDVFDRVLEEIRARGPRGLIREALPCISRCHRGRSSSGSGKR